jgi:hypothetical protein
MRYRLKAFGLHLAGSVTLLTLILGALLLGWYRWPGWYLAGALPILALVVVIDLALGPTLTFSVASPDKPGRVLARDVAVIVTVQLIALIYGAVTLWRGRPLYYTFSADRLEMVQASDIDADQSAFARTHNPEFAPHWYSRPRWVWAATPEDPEQAARIAEDAVFGGPDIIDMPRYFKPWEQGLPQLRVHLRRIDDIKYLSRSEKRTLARRVSERGLPVDQNDAILMWGGDRRLLVVFGREAVRPVAILRTD